MALDLVWSPSVLERVTLRFRRGHQGLLRGTFGVRGILCNLEEYHSDLPIFKNAKTEPRQACRVLGLAPSRFRTSLRKKKTYNAQHPSWSEGAMFQSPCLVAAWGDFTKELQIVI
jgi:hypothetical protein